MPLALAVEPALVLPALAVPATHDLFRFLLASQVDERLPVVEAGPLFGVHAVYAYLMVLVATVTFVRALLRTSRVYRRLSVALAVAAVLPWTANLLFNLEVGPFARVDLTPFLFVLMGAVLVQGLLQGRLLTLARVARDVVVDSLEDGVLVVDAFGRVVEANPAARTLLRPEGSMGGCRWPRCCRATRRPRCCCRPPARPSGPSRSAGGRCSTGRAPRRARCCCCATSATGAPPRSRSGCCWPSGPGSPRRCRPRCSRRSCPGSPGSSPPRCTARPARAARSAATSTSSSRSRTAAGARSSGTSPARAPRPPR